MIVLNTIFPFGKNFYAINLCGVVFAKQRLSPSERRHEHIHTLQQRELLFVGFFIWYIVEWLVRLLQYRDAKRAYLNISFEREAYAHEDDKDYEHHRRHYASVRYVCNP
ncbi:MAG: hypothetical protein IJ897_00160 [Prevotella sp.]|nr:hypothetical protein [Prevotella sp.]